MRSFNLKQVVQVGWLLTIIITNINFLGNLYETVKNCYGKNMREESEAHALNSKAQNDTEIVQAIVWCCGVLARIPVPESDWREMGPLKISVLARKAARGFFYVCMPNTT